MEEQLFLSLITANQGIIRKVCRLYSHDMHQEEDLFQEIILQLWRSIDRFRGDAKISTFIYQVAINTALSDFRKRKTTPLVEYTHELPDMQENPTDEVLKDRASAFTNALKTLPEIDRAIMALVLDEWNYRQIAAVIGITENNVAVKVSRIKLKLKNILTR